MTYKKAAVVQLASKSLSMGLALAVCSSLSLSVLGEVYQWRDENGKLHFSDKKPKSIEVNDISESVTNVNVDESGEERAKMERLFKPETPEERALRAQKAAQQAQRKAKNARQCEEARNTLEILRGPVYFTREDGTSYDISKAEQAKKVAKLERQIKRNCGKL
tara:strand:- start:32404 stop:32892 length:489 start_codon:yes stop_codon:yes gene_type:complete